MDEVKLRPCVWCEGQTKRFQMKAADGAIVEMVEHQGWPHCCVRRDSMTLAQWQSRPTIVTDEVVERVALIIDPVWMDPPEGPHVLENYPGHADHYRERARERARAAIASMPTIPQSLGAIPGSHPADQAPSGLGASRFDPERMARMLRALAHDCENTDGWEDAAPTAHEAADCLLIAATRLAALSEWATTNHVVEQPDTDFESGWDNGYGAARRSVALHLCLASVDTLPKGQDAKQGLAGTEGSAVANGETPTPGRPTIDQDGGWQPIESAPKDRSVILGWPIRDKFPGKVAIGIFGGHDWPSHYGVRARRWQPLPEPPAQPEVNQS